MIKTPQCVYDKILSAYNEDLIIKDYVECDNLLFNIDIKVFFEHTTHQQDYYTEPKTIITGYDIIKSNVIAINGSGHMLETDFNIDKVINSIIY